MCWFRASVGEVVVMVIPWNPDQSLVGVMVFIDIKKKETGF